MAGQSTISASNPLTAEPILEFGRFHLNDEWNRLKQEFSSLDHHVFTFQTGPVAHSIGWHVRHVAEWRYALVHVFICRNKNEERLTCLGWENEPLVQRLTSVRRWYEPCYTVAETLEFATMVRDITDADLLSLPPSRYWETVVFPWRTNRLLDEVFQDTRHSAVHRGQIREIKKTYAERTGDFTSEVPDLNRDAVLHN